MQWVVCDCVVLTVWQWFSWGATTFFYTNADDVLLYFTVNSVADWRLLQDNLQRIVALVRKPLSHNNNLPPTSRDSSFKSRRSCGTESSALEKSKNRQWTVERCSSVTDQSSTACSNKAPSTVSILSTSLHCLSYYTICLSSQHCLNLLHTIYVQCLHCLPCL